MRAARDSALALSQRGRFGYAHNAQVMDVAMFDATSGFEYRWAAPLKSQGDGARAARG